MVLSTPCKRVHRTTNQSRLPIGKKERRQASEILLSRYACNLQKSVTGSAARAATSGPSLQSDPKFVQDAQANTRLESKKVSPRGEGFLTGMPRNFLGNELLVAPIAVVEV